MSEQFVICLCQHCGQKIEFNAVALDKDEQRVVNCPHCHCATTLSMPPEGPILPRAVYPDHSLPPGYGKKKLKAGGTKVTAICLCVIGVVLVFAGCTDAATEAARAESSAIRQTVDTLEYGFGFVMILLSLILRALARLIEKE